MPGLRRPGAGLWMALASAIIVAGSLLTALAETGTRLAFGLPSTPTPAPATPSPTSEPGAATPTGTPAPVGTAVPQPPATATLPPPPTACLPPPGWLPYVVQPGDTLDILAAQTSSTALAIAAANCLAAPTLIPESILYIPKLPASLTPTLTASPQGTPTPSLTPAPCGPPPGWIIYIVKSGDTLFGISQLYGTTVAALQLANCLGNGTTITVGQNLWVPNNPTRTPIPSPSATPTPTSTTAPSATPSPTSTPASTSTPSPTPTPLPTATATPPPTDTPQPTSTAIPASSHAQ